MTQPNAPSDSVLDAATTLALYGRWWVTGINEQAITPRVRRSIAADPVYARELIRCARDRARSLGREHVQIVTAAAQTVRTHQKEDHSGS